MKPILFNAEMVRAILDGRKTVTRRIVKGQNRESEGFDTTSGFFQASTSFADVWDRTIKASNLPQYGFDVNPWVWVIEFERISKEEALSA